MGEILLISFQNILFLCCRSLQGRSLVQRSAISGENLKYIFSAVLVPIAFHVKEALFPFKGSIPWMRSQSLLKYMHDVESGAAHLKAMNGRKEDSIL